MFCSEIFIVVRIIDIMCREHPDLTVKIINLGRSHIEHIIKLLSRCCRKLLQLSTVIVNVVNERNHSGFRFIIFNCLHRDFAQFMGGELHPIICNNFGYYEFALVLGRCLVP